MTSPRTFVSSSGNNFSSTYSNVGLPFIGGSILVTIGRGGHHAPRSRTILVSSSPGPSRPSSHQQTTSNVLIKEPEPNKKLWSCPVCDPGEELPKTKPKILVPIYVHNRELFKPQLLYVRHPETSEQHFSRLFDRASFKHHMRACHTQPRTLLWKESEVSPDQRKVCMAILDNTAPPAWHPLWHPASNLSIDSFLLATLNEEALRAQKLVFRKHPQDKHYIQDMMKMRALFAREWSTLVRHSSRP